MGDRPVTGIQGWSIKLKYFCILVLLSFNSMLDFECPINVGVFQELYGGALMYLTKIDGLVGHRSVMSGFPATDHQNPRSFYQVLYRHDGESTLIQSRIKPSFEIAQTKSFEIEAVQGESYFFRACINSIARTARTGKQYSVPPEDWFKVRNFGAEFSIDSAIQIPAIEESKGHKVFLDKWTIAGVLVVNDSDRFTKAIIEGIGKGKAWGCGLISIVHT